MAQTYGHGAHNRWRPSVPDSCFGKPSFPRQLLKGTHHRIIPHRTSLNNRVLPQLTCIFEAQDFIQAVFTTEYESPAAMSGTAAPSCIACFTFEFMNTVQRVPKSYGCVARQASLPNLLHRITPATGPKCFEERAATGRTGFIDFNAVDNAPLTNIAFMSCPPISRMNDTSFFKWRAAS